MTATWVEEIFVDNPAVLMSSADSRVFAELSELVGKEDLDFLRTVDLTGNIPMSRIAFLKKIVLHWNHGKRGFRNPELQMKLDRFLTAVDDLDLEFFKRSKPVPGMIDRFSLVPTQEKHEGCFSEVTRQNLMEVRSQILNAWKCYASLERSAKACLNSVPVSLWAS